MTRPTSIRESLAELLTQAVQSYLADKGIDQKFEVKVSRTRSIQHGDYTSPIAWKIASAIKGNPMLVADEIASRIPTGAIVESAVVSAPGHINLKLNPVCFYTMLGYLRRDSHRFGGSDKHLGKHSAVEFVSANPTGPLSVVNGRAAVLGDCIARLFDAYGAYVRRDYYVNNHVESTQIQKFAESVLYHYKKLRKQDAEFPEDGYKGAYVAEIAKQFEISEVMSYVCDTDEAKLKHLMEAAPKIMAENHVMQLQRLGVGKMTLTYESDLHAPSDNGEVYVTKMLNWLKEKGHTYEQDGAVFLRTTEHGDDKDRVLVREDGRPTYFLADLAYHHCKANGVGPLSKDRNGWAWVIDIYGADHHGYIPRLLAGTKMIGTGCVPRVILTQMSTIKLPHWYYEGKSIEMMGSKRDGAVVELDKDFVDIIGADAARWFFLMSEPSNHATIDLALAVQRNKKNPVFYVQYAHARLWTMLEKLDVEYLSEEFTEKYVLYQLLTDYREEALIRKICEFPEVVEDAVEELSPSKVRQYCTDLATLIHDWYEHCPVQYAQFNLKEARIVLAYCAAHTLMNALRLLGIEPLHRLESSEESEEQEKAAMERLKKLSEEAGKPLISDTQAVFPVHVAKDMGLVE